MRKIVSSVLQTAGAEIGTEEEPRGSNWGKRVAEYIRSAGYSSPVFWCLCYVYWVMEQALKGTNPLPRTGSCDLLLAWARKAEVLHRQPQAGDIFLVMASEHDATHTGFVQEVGEGGVIFTIEGNSNSGGSRNGYAVVLRERRVTGSLRFVRWADLLSEPEAAAKPWSLVLGDKVLGDCWQAGDGMTYYPARALMNRLHGEATVTKWLTFDEDAQALSWGGKAVSVPVVRREEGTVWAQVRSMASWMGLALKVDGAAKRITLVRQPAAAPSVIK